MTIGAYSFVDMYSRALRAAAHILDKGSEFASANGVAESEMLNWRLIEDMQPLAFQLAVVCNFSRQWPARFVGVDVPPDIASDLDVAGFKSALADARNYLKAFEPAQFEGRDELNLTYTIGTGMTLTLPNSRWLTVFATTNLFFHLSTAYDILRARGVQIGKADLFAGGL